MATADELSRAAAPRFDFEMKFFVGGKWSDVDLDNIEAGQPYDPTVSTTLAEDVDAYETDIDVVSASSLTTGVVILVPSDPAQVYELVKYAGKSGNTLTGCVRTLLSTQVDPASRIHYSGDTVAEWCEITHLVTGGSDRDELRESLATWTVSLEGIQYNSQLLDNDNAVLCLARWRPGAGGDFGLWTSWAVYWFGFIREVNLSDDPDRPYDWTATIQSWSQYLEATDAIPTQYGRINLSENASVTASSTIIDPFTESGNGEFLGSPELTPERVIDQDMSTLWISEAIPVAYYPGVVSGGCFRINEIYLRPAPGMPTHLQWIEIVYSECFGEGSDNLKNYALCCDATHFKLFGSSCEDPGCLPWYPAADNNFVDFPNVNVSHREFVVITNDKPLFLEHWGETGAVAVLDWRHHEVGNFTLDQGGDKLGLLAFGAGAGDNVFWGNQPMEKWYYFNKDGEIYELDASWSGPNLPAFNNDTECPAGCSFHRYPDAQYSDPDDRDNFELRVTTPKYAEFAPTPGETARSSDPEWIALDMGEMGITLEEELLESGETEYVLVSSTLGLTATGRLVIDYEYIDYTGRDLDNNKLTGITRAAGGTSQAYHAVDTPVYQRENNVTYKAYLVSQVGWRRRNVIGTVPSVPKNFEIYFSTLETPIMPDDEDWDDYWPDSWPRAQVIRQMNYSAGGQTSVTYDKTFTPIRARWMLIVIHDMTDQGRAKLNEVHVYTPNPSDAGDITWSGDLIRDLLVQKFGIPLANVTVTDQGTPFIGLSITQQPYTAILNDILKKTSCILIFGRDNVVEHRYDPRFPISEWPSNEIEWTLNNATEIELSRPFRHTCKQVILRAHEPILDEMFEVTYPPTALRLGTVEQVEDQIAGSLDQAIIRAQLLFHRSNGLLLGSVSPVGLAEWARPGQRHTVTWTMDVMNTYLQGRSFLVTSVQRAWSFGDRDTPPSWSVSIDLEELVF